MQPKPTHLRLLQPSTVDRLKLVGEGFSGRVFRHRSYAIKIAHPTPSCLRQIAIEIELLQKLQNPIHGILVPKLYAAREDQSAFVRSFVTGLSLYELLLERNGALPPELFEQVWPLYEAVESFRMQHNVVLDFTPINLFYQEDSHRFLLCDVGVRLAPYRFPDLSPNGLRDALRDYLPWRSQLEESQKVKRFSLPPSGRFHVDVPVGPIKAGRVLWMNTNALLSHDLSIRPREMRRLAGIATHSPKVTTTLPATLYQDSPGKGEGHAKGDGRAVYIGEVHGGCYGRKELMLKGCGPTPLVWTGNEFHEDGFVSFQRSLWEASVADELARLGFETPEVLALLHTGKTTIDNTLLEWPAAAAVRMADTHFRVGHVSYWTDDPDAFYSWCRHIGRTVVRDDFDPTKYTHLREWLVMFSQHLGWNTGKTDALNIHCFNPTMGNVRVDGHFIDFSTVRFHRYYVPHYKFMNNTRKIREHRVAFRRYPQRLAGMWVEGGLLSEKQGHRLIRSATKLFDESYVDGYIEGVCMFLGVAPSQLSVKRRQQLRTFVLDTQHVRKLRSKESLLFEFWRQSCPAPLFDLEGKMPEFVEAWRRGERQPWRVLRSNFEGTLKSFDRCMVRTWFQSLKRLVPAELLSQLQPQKWETIVRPFMEPETLASICYHQSTPESFTLWKQAISTRRMLPLGLHSYDAASEQACELQHVCCQTVDSQTNAVVVGVTEELWEAIAEVLDGVLGDALVGILAGGPRVVRGTCLKSHDSKRSSDSSACHVFEQGWCSERTSPLYLRILVEEAEPARIQEWESGCWEQLHRLYAGFLLRSFQNEPLVWTTSSDSLNSTCKGLLRETIEADQPLRWQGWVKFYDPEGRPRELVELTRQQKAR